MLIADLSVISTGVIKFQYSLINESLCITRLGNIYFGIPCNGNDTDAL